MAQVVTLDCSNEIRIWQVSAQPCKRLCRLVHKLKETCKSISLHPTGFLLALDGDKCIQILLVLWNTLLPHRQIPLRGRPNGVYFSSGGQLIAAGVANKIYVFDTYTGNIVAKLYHKGDCGTVTDVCWSKDDASLFSIQGSLLIQWRVSYPEKPASITYIGHDMHIRQLTRGHDGDILVVSKNMVVRVKDGSAQGYLRVTGSEITRLVLNAVKSTLLVGTSTGTIIEYCYPECFDSNDNQACSSILNVYDFMVRARRGGRRRRKKSHPLLMVWCRSARWSQL